MVIYRAPDSLSKCDPQLYAGFYDVHQKPVPRGEPVGATHSIHKDTLEISHDQLKQEALNRLRHTTKYTIAQGSFMRIGKYVFLALTFPPYLLVVGLPKWLFVEALPTLFSLLSWMVVKGKEKVEKPFQRLTQKIVQVMQFMQQVTRTLIEPIKQLFSSMRSGTQRMREKIAVLTTQFQQAIKQVFSSRPKWTEKTKQWKAGLKRMQERLGRVTEQVTERVRLLTKQLPTSIQSFKKTPQLFLKWGQKQFVSLANQGKPTVQAAKQKAQRGAEWIAQKCVQGQKQFKQLFVPLARFYKKGLQPKLQRMSQLVKGKGKKLKDFLNHKRQQAQAFLQAKQMKLKQLPYPQVVDRFLQGFLSRLPSKFQQWLAKWILHTNVRHFCVRLLQIGAQAGIFVLKGSQGLINQGIKGTQKGSRILQSLKNHLIQGKQISGKIWQVGFTVCRNFLKKSSYSVLVWSLMSGILMQWGLQSLGELAAHLMTKVAFKFKPTAS